MTVIWKIHLGGTVSSLEDSRLVRQCGELSQVSPTHASLTFLSLLYPSHSKPANTSHWILNFMTGCDISTLDTRYPCGLEDELMLVLMNDSIWAEWHIPSISTLKKKIYVDLYESRSNLFYIQCSVPAMVT